MDKVLHIPQVEGLRFWNVKRFRDVNYRQRFNEAHATGMPMIMPLRVKLSTWDEWWTLPIEPLVGIKGGNKVIKRYVAKGTGRGSVKERWCQDDYKITISGIFINSEDESLYPEADVQKLREVVEAREAVLVDCALLLYFDIFKIVIEDWDIPFTSGENQQQYSIKALSDDFGDLLVEREQLDV